MNFPPPPRTTQNRLPTPLFCPVHQGISEHSLMGGGYTPENGVRVWWRKRRGRGERAVVSLSLLGGQDGFSHFSSKCSSFPSSFWSSWWAARPPGKVLATPLEGGQAPGGTHLGKWYGDVMQYRPVALPKATNLPSMPRSCAPPPHFQFKKMHFQPCFDPSFSSQDVNFRS